MTDTLFADVSEFQADVNSRYPYAFFSFRSNDGTYRDHHFAANLKWAKSAVASGKLKGFIVYFVWETNWQQTIQTFKSMVGKPDPRMAVMIDVEGWGGKIRGNHSAGINAARENLISWLDYNRNALQKAWDKVNGRSSRKRVIGYANAGDFASIWPSRGDTNVVIANYSYDPKFPRKVAHQFSDHYPCAPFGHCDMNSADGVNSIQFQKTLGLYFNKISPPPPTPGPVVPHTVPPFPFDTRKPGAYFGHWAHNGYNGNKAVQADIKQIQQLLVKHGFAGKVNATTWCDGIYGVSTSKAVDAFQKSVRMKPNGDIGPKEWTALFKKFG